MLLISLEATTPHVRRCPFILAVLYTQVPTVDPPNRWPVEKIEIITAIVTQT